MQNEPQKKIKADRDKKLERRIKERKEFQGKWGLWDCNDFLYYIYNRYQWYAKHATRFFEDEEGNKHEVLELDPERLWLYFSTNGVLPYRPDIILELLRRLSELDDNGLVELLAGPKSEVYGGTFISSSHKDGYIELINNVRSHYRDLLRQKKINATDKWDEGDLHMLMEDAYCELLRLNKKICFFRKPEQMKIDEILSEIIRAEKSDEVLAEFWDENKGFDPFESHP